MKRYLSTRLQPCWLLLIAIFFTASPIPAWAVQADPLVDGFQLDDLEALALSIDPRLRRDNMLTLARHEEVTAAGEIPDPVVRLGLNNLPVDSFALNQEPMTQLLVTARQALIPRRERDTRQALQQAGVSAAEAQARTTKALVQKEARLTWLRGWKAQAKKRLLERELSLIQEQYDALTTRYRTGEVSQVSLARLTVREGMLREKLSALEGELAAVRAELTRWGANRPVLRWPAELAPKLLVTPEIGVGTDAPQLAQADAKVQQSDQAVALAELAYRPNWTLDAGYGYREDRVDFFTVGLSFSAPLFPDKRQDAQLAAKEHERAAAQAHLRDLHQALSSDLDALAVQLAASTRRLAKFETDILPAQQKVVSLFLAELQTGKGSVASLFEEQFRLVELELQKLELKALRATLIIETRYLSGSDV